MKFVSKISNFRVVLSPGLPGNPVMGIPGKSGVYIKFENGQVIINDEEIIKKMKSIPAFNVDFIAVEETEVDPYAGMHHEIEPEHDVWEINHGSISKNLNPKKPVLKKDDVKSMAAEMARSIVKEMMPDIVKKVRKDIESEESGESITTPEADEAVEAPDKAVEAPDVPNEPEVVPEVEEISEANEPSPDPEPPVKEPTKNKTKTTTKKSTAKKVESEA